MHEIRATMAPEHVAEAARLAHASGIERVAISDVFIDGPNLRHKVVSVETSTPNARLFVEALLSSPVFSSIWRELEHQHRKRRTSNPFVATRRTSCHARCAIVNPNGVGDPLDEQLLGCLGF